jgi:tRNA A-37 threonylcarbamoyl transferase component Bud32
MSDLTGKTIGNYRVLEQIGRGGMATVYKAYQPALERYVALKVIHKHLADNDAQFLQRFQREAKAVASLRHPNIVQVFDFGTNSDVTYMVMEFLRGTTLKSILTGLATQNKTMPLDEIRRVFMAIAAGLGYAHQHGMVHRDIKPANVMVTDQGDVILTDFGIAKIVGGTRVTATHAVTGTPTYMSPEQGRGERGDERSDIYALGILLYEMVTGQVPFDADTPLAVIMKHVTAPLRLPRQINPDIPEPIQTVILKALAKDPNDRFQSVPEFTATLDTAMRQPAGPAVSQQSKPSLALGLGLFGIGLLGLFLGMVLIIIGGVLWVAGWPAASAITPPSGQPAATGPVEPAVPAPVEPTATPSPPAARPVATRLYTSSGRRSEDFYAVAGGTSCCGCQVRNTGRLPAAFPDSYVGGVTFYLTASRADSYYTRVQPGPSTLQLILANRAVTATSQPAPAGLEMPVEASWLVTFEFEPPVRATAATTWMLLDGDHNIYSNVWPHCSDLDQTGLPGTHEIFDCQYAAATEVWYSVRFDLEPASP